MWAPPVGGTFWFQIFIQAPFLEIWRKTASQIASRIGGVVLVAFDVRLHVLRRHQPHLVSKRAQLASPDAAEERKHLPPPQLLTQNRATVASENSIHVTRSHRRIRTRLSDYCNRPLVGPYAVRFLQAAA